MGGGPERVQPGTPEELLLIAIDLLVRDNGAEAARSFIDQVFERYAPHAAIPIAPDGR